MKYNGKIEVLGKYGEDEKTIYIGENEMIEILEKLEGKNVEITITVN